MRVIIAEAHAGPLFNARWLRHADFHRQSRLSIIYKLAGKNQAKKCTWHNLFWGHVWASFSDAETFKYCQPPACFESSKNDIYMCNGRFNLFDRTTRF